MSLRAQAVLELPKVLARLASHASFSLSRELALSLQPSLDFQEVVSRLRLTGEAKRLLELKPALSIARVRDVRAAARQAALGGVLEPGSLLQIRETMAAASSLRALLGRLKGQLPSLWALAESIMPCPTLERVIARCLNERGEVRDAASITLGRFRREKEWAHQRLQEKLQELLAAPRLHPFLQEPIVTMRGGRYVVPVKAECRGEVEGVVHEVSGSGATLFMEPLVVLPLQNRWRELEREEAKEVERVLRRLSTRVGAEAEVVARNLEILAQIDLALAKARFALSIGGVEPLLHPPAPEERPRLSLIEARHPLLQGEVVPLSVRIGDGYHILVITGPNTGGKTVALKTIGLLSLMAQCGLFIPAAPGSELFVCDALYADIGDEQSIEQSLSTFGSHMSHIIEILEQASPGSLVLLDELGAGTEPGEGSALARSILCQLLEQGVTTVATTHHSEIKALAQITPGMMNAHMEFDEETLSPTYRLSIGLPGRSNAFIIARRLGLSDEIVERARQMLTPAQAEVEALLGEVQRQREEAVQERLAAEESLRRARELEQEWQERLRDFAGEKSKLLEEWREGLSAQIAALEERLRRLEASVMGLEAGQTAALRGELKDLHGEATRLVRAEAPPPKAGQPLAAGDWVSIPGLKQVGQVLTPPNAERELEVQIGQVRLKVRGDHLERHEQGTPRGEIAPSYPRPTPPPAELSLRGMRVEEALLLLERYLNDAFLAGMGQVHIIHGKGTGALRQAVRDCLSHHPLVTSYQTADPHQGGEGVTIVELAR